MVTASPGTHSKLTASELGRGTQCEDTLVNAVLRSARYISGAVEAPR